jgi:ABC-2 type transport system ATP-binding protein
MIDILHLSKTYGDTIAVEDLSVQVAKGELFALLGPNGAGKSSTVKVLTGLCKPSTGVVRINGIDVTEDPVEVKRHIGYVPENAMLYESLRPHEYIDLVGELRHMPREQVKQRRDELFDVFGLTDEDKPKLLSEFSKGMKQKVLLISALIHNPDVLILDEPLSGLDSNAALIIKGVIKRFVEGGRTVFFCSHVLDVVERIADRVGIMNRGQLVAIGTPQEILTSTGQSSLELAFNVLTGGADISQSSDDVLRAMSH